ncbi:MAG: apolipoprotein N-acyltransferase [Acidobacteria bacterium]|nr:MAG: apolipoprotein N-acyltransferase [Acidobacteriota bacterium]
MDGDPMHSAPAIAERRRRLYGQHLGSFAPGLIAAAVSGAALAAIFPTIGWDWMAWFALVPLWIVVARAESLWRALWPGYVAGVFFFAISCPWIATTVHRYGDLSPFMAGIVFVCFLLLMGSYLALFALVGYAVTRGIGHRLWPLPFVWVAVELFRTYTPMGGFPWNLLGDSQYAHTGFMMSATIAGVYGASFIIALANTLVAALCLRFWDGRSLTAQAAGWNWPTRGDAALGIALAIVLGFATLPYHPEVSPLRPLHARLVQPNTALNASWTSASLQQFLNRQLALSDPAKSPPVDLILWPEQPAPLSYAAEPQFQATAAELLSRTHATFLFDEVTYATGPRGAPDPNQPHNSALLIRPNGTTGERYDKIHLVPFGEYVPLPGWLQRFLGASKLVQDVGNFVPGHDLTLFHLGGHRFASLICYESIFPQLARKETLRGTEWLVNLSDDSWYGHSSAQAQGLMMARTRAIENHRWLLRDTDNGLTAVIGPYGRVMADLPPNQSASLVAGFQPLTTLTFYTRHGDWLAYACCLIVLLLAAAALLRRFIVHGF